MSMEDNSRAQALVIIILFIIIGGGSIYFYNRLTTEPSAEPTVVANNTGTVQTTTEQTTASNPTPAPVTSTGTAQTTTEQTTASNPTPAPVTTTTSTASTTTTVQPMPSTEQPASLSACENDKSDITPPEISAFAWQNTGVITLWFDSASSTVFTDAYPAMEKNSFVGAISVPTNYICRAGYLTWEQLRTLQSKGWETVSQTKSSTCELSYYNDENIKDEIQGSKEILIAHGLRADNFVMPCGYTEANINAAFVGDHPPIVETVRSNYKSYRTTNDTRINSLPLKDTYNIKSYDVNQTENDADIQKQIDLAINQKGWLILVFHLINGADTDFSITPDRFEHILQLVKDSGLPVIVPNQAIGIKANTT